MDREQAQGKHCDKRYILKAKHRGLIGSGHDADKPDKPEGRNADDCGADRHRAILPRRSRRSKIDIRYHNERQRVERRNNAIVQLGPELIRLFLENRILRVW